MLKLFFLLLVTNITVVDLVFGLTPSTCPSGSYFLSSVCVVGAEVTVQEGQPIPTSMTNALDHITLLKAAERQESTAV